VHGFIELAKDGSMAQESFCGIPHEFVRSGGDNDKVCDVCAMRAMIHLGVPQSEVEEFFARQESDA
jgi:hypothetical protein